MVAYGKNFWGMWELICGKREHVRDSLVCVKWEHVREKTF